MTEYSRISKSIPNNRNERKKEKTTREQVLEVVQIIGDILILIVCLLYYSLETIIFTILQRKEKSVEGEIVLITGTGHGIGKELALQYAKAGATVVGWDISQENNAKTIDEIKKLGYPKAYAYVCNVAKRENVLAVAKKVQEEVGDVSVLINNAGIMPTHSLLDHSPEEIQRIMDINVMAHFWTLQAFLPTMRKNNNGHIVALSSMAGICGFNNLVPYCTSKFAVRGMMESLYEELRSNPKNRIKLTAIYPYMVDTGLCKRPKIRFQSLMPMLKPEDVAGAIMKAQRTDVVETSIPSYLLYLNNVIRTFPHKFAMNIKDFFDSGLESDL